MPTIKEEPHDQPEGLLPRVKNEPPPNFKIDEWDNLTEVIITVIYNSRC